MEQYTERRREPRLDYRWPIWYSHDFAETISEGVMVDISSKAIAFECPTGRMQPRPEQHLTIRFSIPRFEGEDPTATVTITRIGRVCRVDDKAHGICRVAVEFDTPLSLRPGESDWGRSRANVLPV
jgi:hypothetical protein